MANYDSYSPKAAKFLLADGTVASSMPVAENATEVTDAVAQYDSYSPQVAKWLLPDGTITDRLPISGDNLGGGDMTKAEYDTDGNGSVDSADSVPWAGITEKPSSYPSTIADVSGLQTELNSKLTASQAAAVADSTGATDTVLEQKVNELLAALRAAGIMAE